MRRFWAGAQNDEINTRFKKRNCLLVASGWKGGEESRESGNKAISIVGTRVGGLVRVWFAALCVCSIWGDPSGLTGAVESVRAWVLSQCGGEGVQSLASNPLSQLLLALSLGVVFKDSMDTATGFLGAWHPAKCKAVSSLSSGFCNREVLSL